MTHINQRRDYSTVWAEVNPVLQDGEVGWEKDTQKSKLGDGVSAWNDLPYTVSAIVGTKADLGLDQVDNTTDLDKPVSTAAAVALATKADLSLVNTKAPTDSPAFTGNPTAPTPTAGDNDTSLATTAFVTAAINTAIAASKLAQHPVGSIEINVTNVNPSTYIGGTWVAWGSGRVPVGVDPGQAEFDAAEETGGEKGHVLTLEEAPQHVHYQTLGVDAGFHYLTVTGQPAASKLTRTQVLTRAAIAQTATSGNTRLDSTDAAITYPDAPATTAHNNLQPYITCYMWKRTA